MKIGILGSGVVGQALAGGFLKHGSEVMIGTRDKEKLSDWKAKAGKHATLGSVADAAAFGDIVVLAVKGTAAKEALKMAGIDATNPIADAPPTHGVLKFFTTLDTSLMEQLQAAHPKANLVKAFNSIGNAFMVNPDFAEKPTMFLCGNNEGAKKKVKAIVEQFGFEAADMGMAEAARAIEPLCMLWCIPGLLRNEWQHAFRLLT